ncbi:MAG: alpha/beta fold hydrolase [Bacteroidota bacterium]
MELHYQQLGKGTPIIILHGLFGSSDNWSSIGKELATSYQVFLVDQRNHGKSPHHEQWDYEVMSEDLKTFIEQHTIASPVILGHSMGGKTAMWFACKHPQLLSKLIVADMGVRAYAPHHQTILKGLNAVAIDQLQSRKEADEQLGQYIPDFTTRAFLLKNLYRDNGQFAWRINLPIITNNILNIMEGLPSTYTFSGETLFVRGGQSDYVQEEDIPTIKTHFPEATTTTIAEAGHWLHAEQPKAFLETITDFIK